MYNSSAMTAAEYTSRSFLQGNELNCCHHRWKIFKKLWTRYTSKSLCKSRALSLDSFPYSADPGNHRITETSVVEMWIRWKKERKPPPNPGGFNFEFNRIVTINLAEMQRIASIATEFLKLCSPKHLTMSIPVLEWTKCDIRTFPTTKHRVLVTLWVVCFLDCIDDCEMDSCLIDSYAIVVSQIAVRNTSMSAQPDPIHIWHQILRSLRWR